MFKDIFKPSEQEQNCGDNTSRNLWLNHGAVIITVHINMKENKGNKESKENKERENIMEIFLKPKEQLVKQMHLNEK